MKDEIQAGIKNAIERGYTLEEAIQSFISAGYNPVEVKEAANTIGSNVTTIINQVKSPTANSAVQNMTSNSASLSAMKPFNSSSQPSTSSQQPPQQPLQQQSQQPIYNQSYQQSPQRKSKKTLVIILIVILIVLVGAIIALSLSAKTILNTYFK